MSDNQPFARFEYRAVKDEKASREAGRPIYRQAEYVRVIQPQNKHMEVVMEATAEHKTRFHAAYQHFRASEERPSEGAPLDTVPIFDAASIATLKEVGVKTLEAFAGLPAEKVAAELPEFRDLHKQALAYLEAAESKGALAGKYAKAVEELEATRADLATAKAELAAAKEEIKALKAPEKGRKAA